MHACMIIQLFANHKFYSKILIEHNIKIIYYMIIDFMFHKTIMILKLNVLSNTINYSSMIIQLFGYNCSKSKWKKKIILIKKKKTHLVKVENELRHESLSTKLENKNS